MSKGQSEKFNFRDKKEFAGVIKIKWRGEGDKEKCWRYFWLDDKSWVEELVRF